MEFDTSFKEDFPFISSLFSYNNPNSTFKLGFGNGVFHLAKGLVHNFFLPPEPNHHSTPNVNNASLLNNPHHFHRFSIDGSSKNPFVGASSTCTDPSKPNTNGFFSNDLNASLPFAVPHHGTVNKGLFRGFQGESCSDFSENKASAQPLPEIDHQIHHHQHLNFQDQQPPAVTAKLADDISCVTTDQNNGFQDKVNQNKKKFFQTRSRKALNKTNIIKGQWTPQEDRLLMHLVTRHGTEKWSQIAKMVGGKVGKQCRERWHNHLRPDIKKDSWSEEENRILIDAHREIGNKWAEIARRLPGRTDNTVKNHWNATKRRQFSKRKAKASDLLVNYTMSVSNSSSSMWKDNGKRVLDNTNLNLNQVETSKFNSIGWSVVADHNDH